MAVHGKDVVEPEDGEEGSKGEEEETMEERNHPKVSYFPLLCPRIYTSCHVKASTHVARRLRYTGECQKREEECARRKKSGEIREVRRGLRPGPREITSRDMLATIRSSGDE